MKGSASVRFVTALIPSFLGVTSVILLFLVFFSPKGVNDHNISLFRVSPGVNGRPTLPSLFIGPLGSCSKTDSSKPDFKCTDNSADPVYDVSVLPGDTPRLLLSAPPLANTIVIAIALSLTCLFVIFWFCISYRETKRTNVKSWTHERWAERMLIFLGLACFLLGFAPFLVYRMWFGKAVKDFNSILEAQGQNSVLVADTGVSGFAMVYTAYAFIAIMTGIAVAVYGDSRGSSGSKASASMQPSGGYPGDQYPPASIPQPASQPGGW